MVRRVSRASRVVARSWPHPRRQTQTIRPATGSVRPGLLREPLHTRCMKHRMCRLSCRNHRSASSSWQPHIRVPRASNGRAPHDPSSRFRQAFAAQIAIALKPTGRPSRFLPVASRAGPETFRDRDRRAPRADQAPETPSVLDRCHGPTVPKREYTGRSKARSSRRRASPVFRSS